MTNLMSFPVFSLHATDGTKLTKTKDSSYPHISKFNSSEHIIKTMDDLFEVVKSTAKSGGCLLKGFLNRPLVGESRAGSTSPDDMTPWLCFDLDGADYKTPVAFIKDLPAEFHNVTYIHQFSASAGDKPGLRCHLFFRLDRPIYAHVLKTYLQHLNLTIPALAKDITLTKVGVALRWPLDITVCQNDKLIYVAPPEFETKFRGQRVKLLKRRHQSVTLDLTNVVKARNDFQIHKSINVLREEIGLPKRRKWDTQRINNVDVVKNTNASELTGHKIERGFHYINLNGGDSWGYYHKVGSNEVLLNFKGEPNYLIKEVLPAYYVGLSTAVPITPSSGSSGEPPSTQAVDYFAICDPKSDGYSRGYYDPNYDILKIDTTSSLTKLHHFCKAHGQPIPDFVPEWEIKYDFDSAIQYDKANQVINLYKSTEYLKNAKSQVEGLSIPPNINKLLDHVFNYNAPAQNHFLNWLAHIIQKKRQTGTAWILHGTQGTGKGVLFNNIVTPIIGRKSSFRTTLPRFEDAFNNFMEESLVILIDETQVSDLNRKSQAMSNLKQYITDPLVSIRRMHTDPYVVENRANFFIFSNKYDPIQVDANDRRMNVAPRQEVPLLKVMTGTEIDAIRHELQDFASFLNCYTIDVTMVGEVFQSEERTRLQDLTQDSGEEVAERLRQGDLAFFIDNAPDHEDTMQFEIKSGFSENHGPLTYVLLMDLLIRHRGESINLTRDELRVLFYYVNNLIWATPHKFTKYAGHKGLKIETVDVRGNSHRGIRGLVFHCDDEIVKEWNKKHSRKSTAKTIRRIK